MKRKDPIAVVYCPRLYGQYKKDPWQENVEFKRSGAASAAPLQFLTGYAGGCKSRCNDQ